MGIQDFILVYVQSCTGGELPLDECGPLWQFGIIAVLLASAIATLIAVRVVRVYAKSARS